MDEGRQEQWIVGIMVSSRNEQVDMRQDLRINGVEGWCLAGVSRSGYWEPKRWLVCGDGIFQECVTVGWGRQEQWLLWENGMI